MLLMLDSRPITIISEMWRKARATRVTIEAVWLSYSQT
jgi:hypothetical protein